MAASRLAWIVIASVAGLLAAGFAVYFAVNAGGSPGPTPTVQATTTTEVPTTPPPLTEPPTETVPAATEDPVPVVTDTATYEPAPGPLVGCDPQRLRLNVDKLSVQPQLADAVVKAVNEDTVEIDIQGVRFFVRGWGDNSIITEPETVPDQLFEQVVAAIDMVLDEC